MKPPRAPDLDKRRTPEFLAELQQRARAWIPGWDVGTDESDFGRALLEVAARFNSEVAEGLDRTGDKMRRGFLDWLAVPREAARPARLPVVFKLADSASEAVPAKVPVRLQAAAAGASVVFETESSIHVLPGRVGAVVGVDAARDAFYLPPPGLSDLKPLEPLPTQWQLKSFAAAGSATIQLDPDAGLKTGMVLEAAGQRYRVAKVDKDLATIEPPLDSDLERGAPVSNVTVFSPFDGRTRNEQEHVLYIGDSDLLNIESEAAIDVVGAAALVAGVSWQYWGKGDKKDPDKDEVKWRPLVHDAKAQKNVNDAITLKKLEGAIEPQVIAGKNSRWIRATRKAIVGPERPFSVDALKLRINPTRDDPDGQPTVGAAPGAGAEAPGPDAEAMANTTPLVLSDAFYPLGIEPRLFDAFYLGCSEAFSKKRAEVTVTFTMSDATCQIYAAVFRAGTAKWTLAGVGSDGALHLLELDDKSGTIKVLGGSLRPPRPAAPGVEPPQSASEKLNPHCPPVIWMEGNIVFVAVASEGKIWIWQQQAEDFKSGYWTPHSQVMRPDGTPAHVQDIIVSGSPAGPKAILSDQQFLVPKGADWVPPDDGDNLRKYATVAPIFNAPGAPTVSVIAVSTDGELFRLDPKESKWVESPVWPQDAAAPPPFRVDTGKLGKRAIRPRAIDDGTNLSVVAVGELRKTLIAVRRSLAAENADSPRFVQLDLEAGAEAIGAEVAVNIAATPTEFLIATKRSPNRISVVAWTPSFDENDPITALGSDLPEGSGYDDGTPLVVGSRVVFPGGRGDIFVAEPAPSQSTLFTDKVIVEGAILPSSTPFEEGDFLTAIFENGARKGWTVDERHSNPAGRELYLIDHDKVGHLVAKEPPRLIGYHRAARKRGTIRSRTTFDPNPRDPEIVAGAILRITVREKTAASFCEVESVNPVSGRVTVKASTPLPSRRRRLSYWIPTVPSRAVVRPAIKFRDSAAGSLKASTLGKARFDFSASGEPLQPSPQLAVAYDVEEVSDLPSVIALTRRWTSDAPSLEHETPFSVVVEGVIGNWTRQLGETATNPTLSWEYWNGKGWSSLEVTDGTARLASSGTVKFGVPTDIAESDWSGKTNFWIRARLVGGDYGREEVTVISRTTNGETKQTVIRSTENIRAPQVLDLRISYSIDNPQRPTFVIAQDSGTFRDQSDANRVEGAIVEAFVPIGVMLGRLSKSDGSEADGQEPPPDSDCPGRAGADAGRPQDPAQASGPDAARASGRGLYIGLEAKPSEGPVTVLLLVEREQDYASFTPMSIEALVTDRFVPIVSTDATRALGESGLLTMVFALPPTPRELFGSTMTWLRLVPKSSEGWNPVLRGAYLNAVWASATETLTRELLGSSDGAPSLTVRLARPPVLLNTLELRVREPLGEEEREKLRAQDRKAVLSDVDGLPGDWVLWKQVVDPDDEPATARVYALDEATGVIRFGDGRHGRIPPIGRDSIVAFRYCRTEPDPSGGDSVPGNAIAAGTTLNLVSPVESVESVTAADHAAGGSPPEPDDRVLRFGFARLRHRNRAVTAEDIEDLVLQSSPDFVQARAVARRGFLQLVVVERGKNPQPSAAQIRELDRLVRSAAPVSLRAPGTLRIEGPKVRRLRIELKLLVDRLEYAGDLSVDVKSRLLAFFDTASGGLGQVGWAPGTNVSEGEITLAILDAPRLQSIECVSLREIGRDGSSRPWVKVLRPDEIVMLDADPFRIRFDTPQVVA